MDVAGDDRAGGADGLGDLEVTRRWDVGEHEGCGIDSQRAFERGKVIISREELLKQLRAMPSSLNDACRTMEAAAEYIERSDRCITMAMGCLDAESKNPDERLAWLRLSDGMEGREPRTTLSSMDGGSDYEHEEYGGVDP